MINSIKIQGFKGFKDTEISKLCRVNLVVGGQNVGKTTLLEAIEMNLRGSGQSTFRTHEGADANRHLRSIIESGNAVVEIRGTEENQQVPQIQRMQKINAHWPLAGVNESDLQKLEKRLDVSGQLEIWGLGKQFSEPAAIPLYLPSQAVLLSLFGEMVVSRKKKELLELLRIIEPRLISLDAVAPDGEQRIYAEIDGIAHGVPIPQMGHGFARLLYIFSTLLSTGSNVALIDEIENGIHYTALPILINGIKTLAEERQVQTIMTTHSWECLRAACEVFEDADPDQFQVIRLERQVANVNAICIDGARIQRLIAQEREVR